MSQIPKPWAKGGVAAQPQFVETRGGAREGAGRPVKEANVDPSITGEDPETFLAQVMANTGQDVKLRLDAAKVLLAYKRAGSKLGKKQQRADAATEATSGKFGPQAAPTAPPWKQP